MANVRTYNSTKNQTRQLLRPVVLTAGGAWINLETYKLENGGTPTTGWSKTYYRKVSNPALPAGDISALIANMKWELGVNLFATSWYETMSWGNGTFGFASPQVITSGATGNVSITVTALKADGSTAGTISTTSFSAADQQVTSVVDNLFANMSFNQSMSVSGGGSFTGAAYAIVIRNDWTGTVYTDGLTPINPGFCYNTSYLNIGAVKV